MMPNDKPVFMDDPKSAKNCFANIALHTIILVNVCAKSENYVTGTQTDKYSHEIDKIFIDYY